MQGLTLARPYHLNLTLTLFALVFHSLDSLPGFALDWDPSACASWVGGAGSHHTPGCFGEVGLSLNSASPDLCLLSSWDFGCEPLC
jgi:hypothetical protein